MIPRDISGMWGTYFLRSVLVSAILVACCGPVAAQQATKSVAEAPAAWREFSARLKAECEKSLQGQDGTAQRLQSALAALRGASPAQVPARVIVSVWVDGVGTVQHVSFDPLPTAQATADLKAVLSRALPGAPPADMLQPVRLMLSLKMGQ